MKQKLTIEQSAELIKRGIDPKNASDAITTTQVACGARGIVKLPIAKPIFTLADLLTVIPKLIPDAGGDFCYALKIQPCSLPGWTVCYYAYSLGKGKGYASDKELVDALYSCLIWCFDNNLYNPDRV